MKKTVVMLLSALLLVLSAGCAGQETSSGLSSELLSQSSGELIANSSQPPQSSGQSADSLSQEQIGEVYRAVNELFLERSLFASWETTPQVSEEEIPLAMHYEIVQIARERDRYTVTADLFGHIYLDPYTMEERRDYGLVEIIIQDEAERPAFGRSVVRLQEGGGRLSVVACEYEVYPDAGLTYLKAQTRKLEAALSASSRIEAAKYDPGFLNYIWRLMCQYRFIESPEDITLYDLEQYRGDISVGYEMSDPTRPLDASVLALMPNAETVTVTCRLADYGIFENMNRLKTLTIYNADDEVFRTLKVGHTEELSLYDMDVKLLDMTRVNADRLRLSSWSAAVEGFRGCDKIKKLYMMSTRTDMRLINASTFPGLTYLNLYFYSDTPHVRDFSQLATFENAKIDLYLDYQACNNKTIESLRGVKLNDLYLNPENGSYPLPDFDAAAAQALDAKNISFGMEMYFGERTGD